MLLQISLELSVMKLKVGSYGKL